MSPKTVRFKEDEPNEDEDGDIDTADARKRNPKSGKFLLGDGNGC